MIKKHNYTKIVTDTSVVGGMSNDASIIQNHNSVVVSGVLPSDPSFQDDYSASGLVCVVVSNHSRFLIPVANLGLPCTISLDYLLNKHNK